MTLYARSRRVPAAVAAAAGVTGVTWVFGGPGGINRTALVLTVLVLVAVVTATLSGPDDSLDRTAARPWGWLRASHLVAALLLVLVVLTPGPVRPVVRDAAGLLGLTALGASTVGTGRSWFLPLGWTLGATIFPADGVLGEVLTWPTQGGPSRPADLVAGGLALAGFVAYVGRGPRGSSWS
nr:hypothetical protein [Cryptosporangium phraense]